MMHAGYAFASGAGSRRRTAITLTAALHGSLLALILMWSGTAAPVPARGAVATFDLPAEGPPHPALPKALQPRKVPPPRTIAVAPPPKIALPTLSPMVVAMLEQADAQAAAGGCDLAGPVQAALRESAEVQRDLPLIPRDSRSVANAMAIWNQDWVDPDQLGNRQALETIRETIAMTISAASAACRAQPQTGPRLLYLPGASDTVVLALGSGDWTWQQIANTAQRDPNLADASLAAPAPTAPVFAAAIGPALNR